MKIKGQNPKAPNVQILVIPRESDLVDGELVSRNIVIKAQAVLDRSRFEALVERPKPAFKVVPGSAPQADTTNAGFLKAQSDYETKMSDWLTLESLKVTEDLVWDKVKEDDPSTWHFWREELEEADFLITEIQKIIQLINRANGFDDDVYNEALERFLAENRQ